VNGETSLSREFSPVLAGATARRVLTQLRHDPRTIAMMVAVPAVLMILLRYVVANSLMLNRVAPALNAFQLGFPAKILVLLLLSGMAITTLPPVVENLVDRSVTAVLKLTGG